MGHLRPLLVYFHSFQTQILQKTVDVSRIRTRIIRVEHKHADHLTTTTAHLFTFLECIYHTLSVHFQMFESLTLHKVVPLHITHLPSPES